MWFLYYPYNRINISVAIAQVKQAKAAVHCLGPIEKRLELQIHFHNMEHFMLLIERDAASGYNLHVCVYACVTY
jgi:hypothetical protein